jgi:hypothetical protein
VVGKNNIVYYSIINQSVFKYAHKIYNTFSNSNSNNITEKVFHEITGYSTLEMSKIGYNTHVNILEKIYKPPYKNEIKYTTFDAGYEKDLMYLNYMIYITGDKTKYEDLALYNTVLEYKSIIDRYIPCYLDSYLGDKYVKNLYLTKYKSLGLVYDEQGNEHNWNIFILKDKEVNRGKYPSAQIFGYRCSICKATMTDVLKLNNYTISKILLKKTVNSSILSYLYNTCPEHNVHVFVDNVCTKCGYMRNVVDPLLPAVDAYVNKYKTFYEKLIDTTHKHTTTVIVEKQIVYKWEYNETSSTAISTLLGISPNVLKAIGLTTLLNEDDIVKNGDKIPYPTKLHDESIRKVHAYVLLLISEYNRIRNVSNVSLQHYYIDIHQLLIDNKIKEETWYRLHDIVPKLEIDYALVMRNFRQNNSVKPKDIYLFINNMIYDISLIISKTPLGLAFIKEFIYKMVKQEMSLTNHGEYNKALFLRSRVALLLDDKALYDPTEDAVDDV